MSTRLGVLVLMAAFIGSIGCCGAQHTGMAANANTGERKNYSIDDVIAGFKQNELYYYEVVLVDDKYQKTMNKCLKSQPADYGFMKTNCLKNPEFANGFQCINENFIHLIFVYETAEKCEEIRAVMKDKMDAMK